MGKTRRIKTLVSKTNPLSYYDNEINDAFTSECDGPIEAIRDQLQSANIEEKINGLQALSVLTNNKDKAALVCQTDIIRITGPLLCERDHCIRNSAAGALRNLSVISTEICDYLVDQDILTPLLVLLTEYAQDVEWRPTFDVNMCNQIDLYSDIFLQASNLLWNLCESSSIAVDTVNQSNLFASFIRYLDFTKYGSDIAISVGQCLLIISENNPKIWRIVHEHVSEFLDILSLSGNNSCVYVYALISGILSNIPSIAASHGVTIVQTIATIMALDHQAVLNDLMSLQSSVNKKDNIPELDIKMDITYEESEEEAIKRRRRQELPSEIDVACTNAGYIIDAQRVGAEIITNLCLDDNESFNTINDECYSSEHESDIDEIKEYNGNNDRNLIDMYPWFADILKSSNLIDKLWKRTQPLQANLTDHLNATNVNLLNKVRNLRISSILCLQNLCTCLPSEDLGNHEVIYRFWAELGQQVFQHSNDMALLEPCTSLMRSALEHLKNRRDLFHEMTHDDLKLMLDGIRNYSIDEVRANLLRMLGTLGCLLPESLVKLIISFIMSACAQEEDAWTISEGLDALMDMFADNDWPQLTVDLHLVTHLKAIQKSFHSKTHQQRKKLKQRYPAVQTVQTNLKRFIKYIESNKPSNN